MNPRSALLRAALLSSLLACGGSGQSAGNGRVTDSAAGTVALGLDETTRYREVAVASATPLRGVVALGAVDTTQRPLARTCQDSTGATAGVSAGLRALVWVDGITSGKPLPELRRERIVIQDCQFSPRLMATTSGSTVNVFSADPVVHETRFYRENQGEPVAHLLTVDEGQVIPSERIAAEPGIVEARCTRHPWVRGFVAVFEHPYFAITDDAGAFTIDSLAPGTYTVKVWREGMTAPAEHRVVVGPGGAGQVQLSLAPASRPTPAAAN